MKSSGPNRLGQFASHHRLAAPVAPWERLKIGGGTPPVLSWHGWLIIYQGVGEMTEPEVELMYLPALGSGSDWPICR